MSKSFLTPRACAALAAVCLTAVPLGAQTPSPEQQGQAAPVSSPAQPAVPPAAAPVAEDNQDLQSAQTGPKASTEPAAAPSGNMVVKLLNLMVQEKLVSKEKAQGLIDEAQQQADAEDAAKAKAKAAADSDEVNVTYVPKQVRDQIREDLKQDVMYEARDENWAAPRQFPSWLTRISLFGDVRVRYEGDFMPGGNSSGLGSNFWNYNAINTSSTAFDQNFNTNPGKPPTNNDTANRDRYRLRARFGLASDLGDGFSAGFRIGTGADNSPTTENQTLGGANNGQGGDFSKYGIWLDRGFIKYDIWNEPNRDISFTVGRFDNPFFSTSMIWADELGFDGFAAKAKYEVTDGVTPFGTIGAFPVFNTDLNFATTTPTKFQSEDKYLVGAQIGTDWKVNNDLSVKVAGSFYDFLNVEGKVSDPYTPFTASDQGNTDDSRPGFAQHGNSYIALRDIVPPAGTTAAAYNQWQYYGLATPYREAALTARIDYSHFDPFHMWMTGEFVKNVAFDKSKIENNGPNDPNGTVQVGPVNNIGSDGSFAGGDTGWIVGMNFGSPSLQKLWDWNVGFNYRYVESDAVVDGFTDADFGGTLVGTNLKGYTVGGNLALSKYIWLTARWMSADSIAGPPMNEDTFQFDINAKF